MAKPPKQIHSSISSSSRPESEIPRVTVDNLQPPRQGVHPHVGDAIADGPSTSRPGAGDGQHALVEVSDLHVEKLIRETTPSPEAINLSTKHTVPAFVPAHLAATLTSAAASPQAIRYDKLKRTYVDMQEGTVMVQKKLDGGYQQTSASEQLASGFFIERIEGTTLWQKRAQVAPARQVSDESDPVPGPSKRARLDMDEGSVHAAQPVEKTVLSREPVVLDLSSKHWHSWGRAAKPQSGQSIQIGELFYPIVSQIVRSNTPVVCIKHPHFNPERFDAFEQMLRDDPSLQPRWAAKNSHDLWTVADGRLPFEKPLTQYVADSVDYLSESSASAVARAMFRQPRDTEVINGEGLLALNQALRHWSDRSVPAPHRDLADPLLLLPIQPNVKDGTHAGRVLLPAASASNLQRLDFDPQKFAAPWSEYSADPGTDGLKKMFRNVLEKNGYSIGPPNEVLLENALVFHRPGVHAVFMLKLPTVTADYIPRHTRPGTEMTSSAALLQLDDAARKRLSTLLAEVKFVYLIGGTQQLTPGNPTLFILREG